MKPLELFKIFLLSCNLHDIEHFNLRNIDDILLVLIIFTQHVLNKINYLLVFIIILYKILINRNLILVIN